MPVVSTHQDRSDWRLFDAEIRAELAYADALVVPGVLSAAERDSIAVALQQIENERGAGTLTGEDMIGTVARRLDEIAGSAAGKLQAGRSHTEQLLTLLRMWLVDCIESLGDHIVDVQRGLLHQAESNVGALMPAYIHLQPAQVISCSHWLLSYFWMLARDQERLVNSLGRTSSSPLGSGLLAGTPYRVDRDTLAAALGLTDVTQNSLDAVSDWDFVAEFLFAAQLLAIHLGRLAEDLLLYSNPALGFVSFEEDSPAILLRAHGAASRLFGQLAGLLSALKTPASVYNEEAADQRSGLYEVADRLSHLLPDLAIVLETFTINADRMWDAIDESILAADLIDYLAARGVVQREARAIVARVVQRAEQSNTPLSDMEIADFRAESLAFEEDVYSVFDFSRSVGQRTVTGGTAPAAVRAQIRQANAWLVDAGFE